MRDDAGRLVRALRLALLVALAVLFLVPFYLLVRKYMGARRKTPENQAAPVAPLVHAN